jgi:hypothetical protein
MEIEDVVIVTVRPPEGAADDSVTVPVTGFPPTTGDGVNCNVSVTARRVIDGAAPSEAAAVASTVSQSTGRELRDRTPVRPPTRASE